MSALRILRRCVRSVFSLHRHTAYEVRDALIARLNVQGEVKKPRQQIVVKEVPDCPLTDVDSRHETYQTLLSKLSLASDHRQNLHDRGLSDEMIERLGYNDTGYRNESACKTVDE